MRELTCQEREVYRIEPLCVDGIIAQSSRDLLAIARNETAKLEVNSPDLGISFADRAPLILTPPDRISHAAELGENRGQLVRGDFDIWTYEGRADEVIAIRMVADHPLDQLNHSNRPALCVRCIRRRP